MTKPLAAAIITLLCAIPTCAQKRMSDRDADGLKSRVKTVITEGVKLTNESSGLKESERKLKSVETYDENGNYTEKVLYDIGDKHIYTFIDGDKTVKITRFQYGNNPPPIIVGQSSEKGSSAPRDSRFDFKFKYKYDAQGNITEKAWYHNDGSLWLRYVNVFDAKGNRTKHAQYRTDGSLGFEVRYKHDEKGNVIEESWDYPDSDRYDHTNSYTYEFDSNGNWIKRNNSKVIIRDSKTYLEPLGITYRNITYYQD